MGVRYHTGKTMPYVISSEGGILYITFSGIVGEDDLGGMTVSVMEFESNCVVIPPRITDLTNVSQVDLDFSSILDLAKRRMAMTLPNAIKSAIVVSRADHMGFARMFQTVNRHPKITIRIFPDMDGAREWLAGD